MPVSYRNKDPIFSEKSWRSRIKYLRRVDLVIVPNKTIELALYNKNINHVIIHDAPGERVSTIQPDPVNVRTFLNIGEDYCIISVPFLVPNVSMSQMVISAMRYLDSHHVKAIFVVYANPKAQASIESFFKGVTLSTVKLQCLSLYTDAYLHILPVSDFAVVLFGSTVGTDVASNVHDMIAVKVPILVYSTTGSLREFIKEGQNGLFFKTQDEFDALALKLCADKNELSRLRENYYVTATWDEGWENMYSALSV